jgi:hypothetical protein
MKEGVGAVEALLREDIGLHFGREGHFGLLTK